MYTASAVTGRTTHTIQGFVTIGTITPVNRTKILWREIRNALGNTSSIQPTSLENRFKILPTGFESKNRTGACNTARTILS